VTARRSKLGGRDRCLTAEIEVSPKLLALADEVIE
jgi:hypothetical protein